MWKFFKPRSENLWLWQIGLLFALFVFWHVMTVPGLIPPMMFDNDRQAAFFFGEPLKMAERIWTWFVLDADIYQHLGVTLAETLMAFAIGSGLGLAGGLWLALSPLASALLEPYIKAVSYTHLDVYKRQGQGGAQAQRRQHHWCGHRQRGGCRHAQRPD